MKNKFAIAMVIYGVLGVIGFFVLQGQIRLALMILLGGLVLKTLIARGAGW